MKKKTCFIIAAILAGIGLLVLTACGSETPSAGSTAESMAESSITSETSASLGIYVQDTDNDGIPDKVVDRKGADLSHLYTLQEDGIYEGETLVLPLAQTEVYVPATESGTSSAASEAAGAHAGAENNENPGGANTGNASTGHINAGTSNTGNHTPGNTTGQPSQGTGGNNSNTTVTPHIHTWVDVSPENSGYMNYASECRAHGYNGEEPMFFQSQNDLFLHHAADNCMSSWGWGFKGLAYRRCTGCGEEIVTGHVHDFGTIAKQVYFETVKCECGMSFSGGSGYTALDSWKTHVEIYTNHGYPYEAHDTYQTVTSSITRYEATKTCTCGWRPVDNRPVY